MSSALELTRAHSVPDFWQPPNLPPDDPIDLEPAGHLNPFHKIHDEAELARIGIKGGARATLEHLKLAALLARFDELPRPYAGRQEAFRRFAAGFKLSYDLGKRYIRLFKAIPVEFWARYTDLSWELLLEIERVAKAPGDTAQERRARVLGACEQALTREFTEVGARILARELVDADRKARGLDLDTHLPADLGRDSALGVPGPAEAPPARVRASVERDGEREQLTGSVECDQTHAFVGDPRQPDLPATDAGLLARVQRLEQLWISDTTRKELAAHLRANRDELGSVETIADVVMEFNRRKAGVL